MALKVAVFMGGWSSEREVSLTSGKGVAEALREKNYTVVPIDLTPDLPALIQTLQTEKPDVVFNALHGPFGEDGTIQAILDLMQIPYTHSGVQASAIAMDKVATKRLCAAAGVPCAEDEVLSTKDYLAGKCKIPLPHVVKAVNEGSSIGVFVLKTKEDKKSIIPEQLGHTVLVEKFIEGRELTVTVLGEKALTVTDLNPSNEFYDFEAKYTDGVTEHILPADIPEDIFQACLHYSEVAHKTLGCSAVSRSDFRYNEKDGVCYLETNTQPGMTALSLVPEAAAFVGISYADLCDRLVKEAKCRPL
ncbi:MAG: D-alanine--D-alanine ligase [Alphaproteobacteria bacterium]